MDPVFVTVRPAVVLASVAAAASRSVIEAPFELVKTRLQWGQVATSAALQSGGVLQHFRGLVQGHDVRNVLLLGTIFTALDAGARLAPGIARAPLLGPFFQGSVCNTLGWAVAWPFELLKSKVQGDTTGMLHRRSTVSMLSDVVHADGVRGMWRGFVLGGSRSFVVNGCSMVTHTHACVCTHTHTHASAHACVRTNAYAQARAGTRRHAHAHTHEHTHEYASTCTHSRAHTQTRRKFHTHTQARRQTETHTHTHRWLTNGSSISAVRAAPRLSSDSWWKVEGLNPLATFSTYADVPPSLRQYRNGLPQLELFFLYLPTSSHSLIVNKLLSLDVQSVTGIPAVSGSFWWTCATSAVSKLIRVNYGTRKRPAPVLEN